MLKKTIDGFTLVSEEIKEQKKKYNGKPIIWRNKTVWYIIIPLLVLIEVLGMFFFIKDTSVTVTDTDITVGSLLSGKVTVKYEDIITIGFLDEFDIGKKVLGQELKYMKSGTYENDEYGEYDLYIVNSLSTYIAIKYEGGYLVFNHSSEENTKEIYEYLTYAENHSQ